MTDEASSAHTLQRVLLDVLESHHGGVSEYDLLSVLREQCPASFGSLDFRDPLKLFRGHFLLFHHLYRLQGKLADEQRATLRISPLLIQLLPYSAPATGLPDQHDPLCDYYLDLSNLDKTDSEQLQAMLSGAQQRMRAHDKQDSALEILGLTQTANETQIRRRVKHLKMRHHPDRGGDAVQFNSVCEAFAVLIKAGRIKA